MLGIIFMLCPINGGPPTKIRNEAGVDGMPGGKCFGQEGSDVY